MTSAQLGYGFRIHGFTCHPKVQDVLVAVGLDAIFIIVTIPALVEKLSCLIADLCRAHAILPYMAMQQRIQHLVFQAN